MHFRKLLNSDCLSAEDFVDQNFNPVERTLTISGVTLEKPPAGGKEKPCLYFAETQKKAFVANGEIKKLARFLRCAETDLWVGAKLVISSADKKFAGKSTTGMIIVSAKKEAQNVA
jgi:hypothetical protein